ncbi:MAG: choice-of-anchor U domain-containing protein, partial [Burkholderiaceae bacterium]|nr:choice-of-anchor U domain-containing protein [Burkholderiaceae bacterium]
TGEGGATYTLTDTANVDITSGTSFTLSLSATDQAAVEQILNKAGTSSTGATTYNLAAAEDWAAGADAAVVVADTNGNGITVSNVPLPTITSATYSAGTNTLVVTGTGFVSHSGAANDIDVSKLTFTGHGGAVYTLTDSADVEITSGTSFSVTLSAADQVAVENLMDKAGTSSIDGTTYNLAAAEDWAAGADAALNVADLTGNGIAATLNASPVVTSNGGGATAAIDVAENTVAVTTVTTTDADGDSITYSLTGGADQAKFTIDASTGALVFVAAPDYEHPTDADANNSYLVDVTASDGHGGTSVQTITVSVTNVDEYVAPPDDDDGVSTEVETQVPGLDTGSGSAVAGDGNGDGIADSQQADVTSTTFADETQGTQTYVTLVAGSDAGTPATGNASITHIEQLPVPADVPAEASLPLGLVSFTAEIGTATSETFSLFVSDQYVVNGYWKQAADGHWANIASAIEHVGHSWRIDFTITDGGEFDADGTVNGVIVDPGAVGYLPRESANTSELVAGLYAAFYDRAPGAAGLAYWVDELNSGSATLIDIARSFSEHPRFAQEYGGLDNAALAAKFYTNVLGQSGGAGGIAYWTAQLDAGTPVYQVMAAFIDCALNLDLGAMLEAGQLSQSDYTIACQRQTLLDNRVKAGLDFANLFGTSTVPTADATHLSGDAAYNAAIHVLDLVTADPESAYALAEQMATLVGTTDPMEAVLALA